ncbi:hypothetical protein BJ996_003148 [Streptomyces phaeogriseichromatogenes]|nr:hypothetical protein [Streptomyces murinus]
MVESAAAGAHVGFQLPQASNPVRVTFDGDEHGTV